MEWCRHDLNGRLHETHTTDDTALCVPPPSPPPPSSSASASAPSFSPSSSPSSSRSSSCSHGAARVRRWNCCGRPPSPTRAQWTSVAAAARRRRWAAAAEARWCWRWVLGAGGGGGCYSHDCLRSEGVARNSSVAGAFLSISVKSSGQLRRVDLPKAGGGL